ncbi:MAG: nucleotidyltransferase domain-containing protein [Nanoarchaeota archaeon]
MLQKRNMQPLLDLFNRDPLRLRYLLGISRGLKLAHTSVKRDLDALVKRGIVQRRLERRGKRSFPLYVANEGDALFRQMKKLRNFELLYESGLVDAVADACAPRVIVVFGSYRRGEDLVESDIDLFVESLPKKIGLSRFERTLGRKIHILFEEKFGNLGADLKNNVINGFVLRGYLEAYDARS